MVSAPVYQFNGSRAIAVAGGDLFVVNNGGGSVTELNASTGALVRVLSGSAYQFDGPDAMAVAGGDLFVANFQGNSVTELPLSATLHVRRGAGGRPLPLLRPNLQRPRQ